MTTKAHIFVLAVEVGTIVFFIDFQETAPPLLTIQYSDASFSFSFPSSNPSFSTHGRNKKTVHHFKRI